MSPSTERLSRSATAVIVTGSDQHAEARTTSPRRRSVRIAIALALFALPVTCLLCAWPKTRPRPQQLLKSAHLAYQQGRYDDALRRLEQIPDDGSADAVQARCLAGTLSLEKLAQPAAAELQFRRVVAQDEDNPLANERLAYLMHLGTCYWELVPCALSLIRAGRPSLRQMKVLSLGPNLKTDRDYIRKAAEVSPRDPLVLLGMAAIASDDGDYALAAQHLRAAITIEPHSPCVEFRLGQVLLLANAGDAALQDWHRSLPSSALDHPGIWSLLGNWAMTRSDAQGAARCYWEALRRDPNLREANFQLAQLLASLHEDAKAAPFFGRARRLAEYDAQIEMLNARRAERSKNVDDAIKTAEMAEDLGLVFEAYGWYGLTLELDPANRQAREAQARLDALVNSLPRTRTLRSANPALRIDLSDYPLPDWHARRTVRPRGAPQGPLDAIVRFEDRAAAAGLNFLYFNGQGDEEGIYSTTGGGVAAVDYDGDGWSDLYFTQGTDWPEPSAATGHFDQLYRNLGNGRFQEVAAAAGLAEDRFSQGIAAGDYDNDGFPDLYVATLTENRLYHNNGDGTFTDVTAESGVPGDEWTTSCAIADLNGDGLPDIYAVNYLGGPALTLVCRRGAHIFHDCTPAQFPAAQDRLFLNRGEGTFEDVTASSGITHPNGKGLGILIADIAGSGQCDVFIANDGVPNFLLTNQAARGQPPLFVEHGILSGVAVNAEGLAEAGMGIAAGDLDHNGLLDLLVTNFFNESNTLYLQQPDGLFVDRTRACGLHEPSLPMLGFGTQCIDGELDGLLDLVVTNGHIDRTGGPEVPFEMRPQYFRNLGQAEFEELHSPSLGGYFHELRRGRGLARLDWNHDGLEDLAVSHLDTPAALLTNLTLPRGHSLALSLRGVHSDRDAIGTTVRLRAGGATLMRQLTAGDGYHASNERILIFGLGPADEATDIHIAWPSGIHQHLDRLAAEEHYLVVENGPAFALRARHNSR